MSSFRDISCCAFKSIFSLRDISEEHRKLSLEEETIWLQIRSLTLRLISGLPTLGHSAQLKNSEKTSENGVSSTIDSIRALLQELDMTVNSGKNFLEQKIQVYSGGKGAFCPFFRALCSD